MTSRSGPPENGGEPHQTVHEQTSAAPDSSLPNLPTGPARRALITGITGQDGSYLAEFLLSKGYEVHGVKRRSSSFNSERVDHLYQDPHEPDRRFILHFGDLTDSTNALRIVEEVAPDEIYNLAAQSHVAVSFDIPEYSADVNALGTLRMLEAIRTSGRTDDTRFYQASTSELFGATDAPSQNEATPFHPRSPYAVAKLYAYWMTVNYREAYGGFAANGVLFNHESPRRGETFVTRKITRAVASFALGRPATLYLGNLDARRDWGHARDYVRAKWLILQHDEPDDFVIGTGRSRSVREFVEHAFVRIGVRLEWTGQGVEEVAQVVEHPGADLGITTGQVVVRVDPRYFRPAEVEALRADASKAKRLLGWTPEISFDELVAEMVDADIARARLATRADLSA